ncbi:MAG: hypothetical protein ACHWZW_06790 [Spirulina sp.]
MLSLKSWLKPVSLGIAVAAGTLASLSLIERPAQADFSIAYCDGDAYAINIYYPGDPESGSPLTMRLYYRADRVVFLNTEVKREPNPEGHTYSNVLGENQWELFIPNGSDTCTLSRDGQAVDTGTVTMRESPTQGD